jgi:serine/threonine-protein kinase RsbW
MDEALSLQFKAMGESIPRARHAISDLCARAGIPDDRLRDIQIAVTEACTNCVLYAYDALDDDSLYMLEAQLSIDHLLIVVSDGGVGLRGYTPGLGMSLIQQAADRVLVTSPGGRGSRVEMHFTLSL